MKEIIEITPPQAWDILCSDPAATLIDVRSRMEFEYVGHPVNAYNIPWAEPPDWSVNREFTDIVWKLLQQLHPGQAGQLPVLTICRSGQRSRAAGQALLEAGFTRVYNVLEGFEGDKDSQNHRNTVSGWRVHHLPWEQS
jgi:rhodanese-related sulfurtransferase